MNNNSNNNFFELIAKGVPITTPIAILSNDLYELTNDKKRLISKVDEEFKKYLNYLNSNFKSNDVELFSSLCIASDSETLDKHLYFSVGGFISSLLYNLNVDNACNKGITNNQFAVDEFKKRYAAKIKKRIGRLSAVTSENSLRKEFPFLYNKYYELKTKIYDVLKPIIEMIDDKNTSLINKARMKAEVRRSLLKYGIDTDLEELLEEGRNFSVKSFCKSYAETFNDYFEHIDEITEYLSSHPLDINELGIEPEKLELYIASISMKICEHADKDIRQKYLYFVTTYFNSNKERKTSTTPQIRVGIQKNDYIKYKKSGKLITPKDLYLRYREFISQHPEIQVIDLSKFNFEGMNILEVERFLFEYLKELQANWEILPEGELDEEIVRAIRNSGRNLPEEEREKHKEYLMNLLVEKKELYGSTDPFFRIRGKDTFDGYVGFIYPNGKVILDKFYENAELGKLADGEAIYVMNVEDFYRLSQYSKSTLIKDSRVLRFYHAGAWQDRVLEEIKSGCQRSSTVDEVKRLIKMNKLEEE